MNEPVKKKAAQKDSSEKHEQILIPLINGNHIHEIVHTRFIKKGFFYIAMVKQRFVLDTSAFIGLGRNRKETVKKIKELVKYIGKARETNVSCYIPPSIWKELVPALENRGFSARFIRKLDAVTIQKSPSKLEIFVPAKFIYDYVEEMRERFTRGLKEAEKFLRTEEDPDKKVSKLRRRYREIIRKGIIDSTEDLDVLMLAKELNAGIVTKDEGIIKWAKLWGIRYIPTEAFPELLKENLKRVK